MSLEKVEVKFSGYLIKELFNKDDYSICSLDVDINKYKNIKRNNYGNVSIQGNIGRLNEDVCYEIDAVEENGKYGYCYKVTKITRSVPSSKESIFTFLSEILTNNQAEVIVEHYPNIINIIKENRINEIDVSKLNGIGEKTLSKIVSKIQNDFVLVDLVNLFNGTISLSVIRKLYCNVSSVEELVCKLNTNPYQFLCSVSGIGFKRADSILLQLSKCELQNNHYDLKIPKDLISSYDRCRSAVVFLLKENENNGNTRMSLVKLRSDLIHLAFDCSDYFTDVLSEDLFHYNKEDLTVSLKKTFLIEDYICKRILLANKNNTTWDIDHYKYRNVDGFDLSDEQMGLLENIKNYNVSILNGFAGSGKSFSVISALNMLKDNKKSFALLSPTGKASKVLAEYTNEPAYTIHRYLGYIPPNTFSLNEDNQINVDVVFVDEFSMVDIFLFKNLLQAINFEKTKMVLIGDSFQLPSVSCGNLLQDFVQSKKIPTVTLSKIFRYESGGLMKIATDIRYGKPYLDKSVKDKVVPFGSEKDYVFIDVPQENILKKLYELVNHLVNTKQINVEDIKILTSKNIGDYGTVKINNLIQMVANKENVQNSTPLIVGNNENEIKYYLDDIVIQKSNNYEAVVVEEIEDTFEFSDIGNYKISDKTCFVANGEFGKIKYVDKNALVIDFGGISVLYNRKDLESLSLGYSITCHKSQGSSSKYVILLTPKSHTFMLNSNLLYVGVTRTKKQCYHLGSYNTVNTAIKKKANLERETYCSELLENI